MVYWTQILLFEVAHPLKLVSLRTLDPPRAPYEPEELGGDQDVSLFWRLVFIQANLRRYCLYA